MINEKKAQTSQWFTFLRDGIVKEILAIEKIYGDVNVEFVFAPSHHQQKGNSERAILRGQVFEKIGVNISTVEGVFTEEFRKKIPGSEQDGKFWTSGISLVAHLHSPKVPAIHMNTRYIITTEKSWFGGGIDLTPYIENIDDTKFFHKSLKKMCDQFSPNYYAQYSKWCNNYFYLPHRKETRGVGGIFFDYLNSGNFTQDFAFAKAVGEVFLASYKEIINKRMYDKWSIEQKNAQLYKRGRYVEFNLLYDRGTLFGLETGGDSESILMSMPPSVKW